MLHGFCSSYIPFYNFAERISFAEHWKLVAESSDFHLTLSRVHFFPTQTTQNKRDILSEKRDGAKKREFMPESGNVDTYVIPCRFT